MQVEMTGNQENREFLVKGRIDTGTAPEFQAKLMSGLAGAKKVRINMEKVDYVSSAGLRAFLNGQKYANQNGIEMILFNVADSVTEVFEITGFIDILNVE